MTKQIILIDGVPLVVRCTHCGSEIDTRYQPKWNKVPGSDTYVDTGGSLILTCCEPTCFTFKHAKTPANHRAMTPEPIKRKEN